MSQVPSEAPGTPGGPEVWNSGSKIGVGTALGSASLVWFTLGRGVIEEVYFPRADHPRTRDLGLAVVDGADFFSWEKDDAESEAVLLEPGVPSYRLANRCRRNRYWIEKDVFSHPDRSAVVQRTRFLPAGPGLQLHAILNPHLGPGASGWVGDFKGVPMLFAAGSGVAVALASSAPWLKRSVGFVGTSDGWQDLSQHKRMRWEYDRASGGNVALTGQIDYVAADGAFLLVLGFGLTPEAAGLNAHAAVLDGFDAPLARYTVAWKDWQKSLLGLAGKTSRAPAIYRASAAVLRTHEAKQPPGAAVASLAVPFGQARAGADTGGYHLVWPRDLVETAGGLLAAGAPDHALATLELLASTQELDGHWAQNMWLSGKPYWSGIQMDETALAILLVDLATREKALKKADAARFWPMVRNAAGYLVRNGPVTPEDRWEHDGGYSTFTLAAEITALLVAADLASENGAPALAEYLRGTADVWNDAIERWTYVTGTELARRVGVDGYYVRLGQPAEKEATQPGSDPRDGSDENSVSPDALALVRFGLRTADDPRIVNTVKVIDAVLKVDLGYGPGWRRYTGDRYGEYPDGRAYDRKGGVGRAWPLFAGERGHYELAAGRPREAKRLLRLMEHAATDTGLIPEQVWDADDIPEKGLFRGRPTTSACPLVWAHAEYVKLLRSLRDGAIFDQPRQGAQRYGKDQPPRPQLRIWKFNNKIHELPAGSRLRVEATAPAVIRWSPDGWKDIRESETTDTGLGVYAADLPTGRSQPGSEIVFTFHWTANDHWEGRDFRVAVSQAEADRDEPALIALARA